MAEIEQSKFEGRAIVDVLGHQRYVGFVTTEAYGQAVLFRVDVPALEARVRESKAGEYVNDRWVPAGTKITEGASQGYSKLIGAGSIYAISPCAKEAAIKVLEATQQRPLLEIKLPEGRALSAGDLDSNDDDLKDDDDDGDIEDTDGLEDRDLDEPRP